MMNDLHDTLTRHDGDPDMTYTVSIDGEKLTPVIKHTAAEMIVEHTEGGCTMERFVNLANVKTVLVVLD